MGSVRLWPYEGEPLAAEAIVERTGYSDDDSLFLVATSGQATQRGADFRPRPQWSPDDGSFGLVFREGLRACMVQAGFRRPLDFLGPSESRIMVRRAIRSMGLGDAEEARLLADAAAWQGALVDLAGRGGNLDECNVVAEATLEALDDRLAVECLEVEAEPVDAATRSFIDCGFPTLEVGTVVLEGFTFLTPLQRRFVEAASEIADVHCFFPWREDQEHGFEVMERTYRSWWDERADPAQSDRESTTRLDVLREGLFKERKSTSEVPTDGTFESRAYTFRHEEVSACISALKELAEDPDEIAIVTTHPSTYVPMLREEAERQALEISLNTPPRRLLLTPVGQFVLALYEAWDGDEDGGEMIMSPDVFERILSSGWVTSDWREGLDLFRSIRAQSFEWCETAEEWAIQFDNLDDILADRDLAEQREGEDADNPLPPQSREPIAALDRTSVAGWREAVETVDALCARLFGPGDRSVAQHVEQLLEVLTALPDRGAQEAELELMRRVQEELGEVSAGTRLEIGAAEFGEMLSGLVREHEEEDLDDRDREDGPRPAPGQVWVTTPVGIDGISRRFVFLLGCDDQRFPAPFSEPWPFPEVDVDEHVARQRYLFLAVVRACTERLSVSYSRLDLHGAYGTSPYLLLSETLLGSEVEDTTPDEPGDQTWPDPAPVSQVSRDRYTLAELTQFGLCPFRYKLERLEKANRTYGTHFQLVLLAQAVWVDLVCRHLEGRRDRYRNSAEVDEALRRAFTATELEMRRRFPGFGEADWATVEEWARRKSERLGYRDRWHPRFQAFFQPARRVDTPTVEVATETGESTIGLSADHYFQRGSIPFPILDSMFGSEWLRPATGDEPTLPDQAGLSLFPLRYDANQWWANAMRTRGGDRFDDHTARSLVESAESGSYPRRPGEHCSLCPVQSPCLGLEHPLDALREEGEETTFIPSEHGRLDTQLTDEQEAIVRHVQEETVTVASAGAGTGKTHTMVASVVRLIETEGTTIDRFALITFTKEAARELRERLRDWLTKRLAEALDLETWRFWFSQHERICAAHVGTIHSFCRRLLDKYGYAVAVPRSASTVRSFMLFQSSLDRALDAAYAGEDTVALTQTGMQPFQVRRVLRDIYDYCSRNEVDIESLKAGTAELETPAPHFDDAFASAVARTASSYKAAKDREHALDPDDELRATRDLLHGSLGEETKEAVGSRFDQLFVDEFQDTDALQADIVASLLSVLRHVLVVGDPRQAIYAWRGGLPSLLEAFAVDHQRDSDEPLPLNISRRPTRALLDVQQGLFERMRKRYPELKGRLEVQEGTLDGGPTHPMIVDGATADPALIASYIDDLLAGNLGELGGPDGPRPIEAGDIAILARSNRQTADYETSVTALLGGAAEVRSVTGGVYFTRPEIQSVLRMLHLLLHPENPTILSLALETPFFPGVDPTAIEAEMLGTDEQDRERTLWDWLVDNHRDIAETITALARRARRDTPAQVISSLYQEFGMIELFRSRGHERAVANLGKLHEQAYRLFREEQALTLAVFVDWLTQAMITKRPEPDALAGLERGRPAYVRAMTIHSAKGLEFPVVIVPNAGRPIDQQSLDPSFLIHQTTAYGAPVPSLDVDLPGGDTRSAYFDQALARSKDERRREEMRLLYVAITRAQQSVILLGGGQQVNDPGSERYAWKDEIRRASDVLTPLGASFR